MPLFTTDPCVTPLGRGLKGTHDLTKARRERRRTIGRDVRPRRVIGAEPVCRCVRADRTDTIPGPQDWQA